MQPHPPPTHLKDVSRRISFSQAAQSDEQEEEQDEDDAEQADDDDEGECVI